MIMALAVNHAFAQTETVTDNGGIKPRKGSFATELNFNPFKGNLSLNNSLNQIKGRYFISDAVALRAGLSINVIDSTFSSGNPYGAEAQIISGTNKRTGLGINIGIERHFKGTKRLSPYIGLDLTWSKLSASQEMTTNGTTTTTKNAWLETQYRQVQYYNNGSYYYTVPYNTLTNNAYTRFGVAAIAGFDYYVAKNLFLGYEFNLGYAQTSYKSPESETTGQTNNTDNFVHSKKKKEFGTSLINGIRIGYAF